MSKTTATKTISWIDATHAALAVAPHFATSEQAVTVRGLAREIDALNARIARDAAEAARKFERVAAFALRGGIAENPRHISSAVTLIQDFAEVEAKKSHLISLMDALFGATACAALDASLNAQAALAA